MPPWAILRHNLQSLPSKFELRKLLFKCVGLGFLFNLHELELYFEHHDFNLRSNELPDFMQTGILFVSVLLAVPSALCDLRQQHQRACFRLHHLFGPHCHFDLKLTMPIG